MPEVKPRAAWERKVWYTIVSPEFLGSKPIEETPAARPQDIIGRTCTVLLSDLTGDMRHYQTEIRLRIARIEGNVAHTVYDGQTLSRDAIARMIRRRSSRIDVVQDIITADGKRLRLKTLAVSARRINTATQSAIRAAIAKFITERTAGKRLEDIVTIINFGKLLAQAAAQVKKIYPVRAVELRAAEIL